MNEDYVIAKTIEYVKFHLNNFDSAHDWDHVSRVYNLANYIQSKEGGNLFVIKLGSLLHDIADYKFYNGNEIIGGIKSKEFLETFNLNSSIIKSVEDIVNNVSFKGMNSESNISFLELDIVKDADRLDAIGAIGIARTFNYGGYKNNKLYDPQIKPNLNVSKEEYMKSKCTTINHFYEKLLNLKNLMKTNTGKEIAKKRHDIMEQFLNDFFYEWNFNS